MHWNVMTRGQIVFYAFLALIALIQAFGQIAAVWVVHLSFIAIAVKFTILWGRLWMWRWDEAEEGIQKGCLTYLMVLVYLIALSALWGLDSWISADVQKWIEAQ